MTRRKPDPKADALREHGCLHPSPEKVVDELFASGAFFDARDLVQVKYEMLRRVRVDGNSVSDSAARFGLSRPSYYQAQAAFDAGGLQALLEAQAWTHWAEVAALQGRKRRAAVAGVARRTPRQAGRRRRHGTRACRRASGRAEQDAEVEVGSGEDDGGPGDDKPHRRPRKPTGRKTGRDDVPKLRIEIVPDEVKRLGLDAFERIGEETSTTIERRVSSIVEVTMVRPKFRAKTEEAEQTVKLAREEQGLSAADAPEAWITIAPPLTLPIPRGMVGPGLLANVIVRRFDDHLPYNRLENVYEREGMRLGRSTLYGWLDQVRPLFAPLVSAMRADAKQAAYLCIDATGVLVQAPEKCARGHFWVLVAPAATSSSPSA